MYQCYSSFLNISNWGFFAYSLIFCCQAALLNMELEFYDYHYFKSYSKVIHGIPVYVVQLMRTISFLLEDIMCEFNCICL